MLGWAEMGGKCVPGVDLTESGRPILLASERECSVVSNVDLESEEFPPLKGGTAMVTTHRLIWISSSSSDSAAVPLASVSHVSPLKKSMFGSPRLRLQSSLAPITLVIRGKADSDAFAAHLRGNWMARAWEEEEEEVPLPPPGFDSSGMRLVGVSGILRKEQQMWETTDKTLHDAFQDLNALMSKAKEMVLLAETMRHKLLSQPNDHQMGSNQEMQDWMLSIGILSPVTKETAGAQYHQQLSRQLADFVRVPLDKAGGMINLIDVYCLFNRARGTELISPEDLLQACAVWEKFDVPVMLRKFESGVMVIQHKSQSDEEVLGRIKILVTKSDALRNGISASDAAMTLGIAPAMAKEHLLTAETRGLLCRDVSPEGFRFYINLFPDINTDDRYLVRDHSIYCQWARTVSASW